MSAEQLALAPETQTQTQPKYFDADQIPELYLARHQAAQEADQIQQQNSELLVEGNFESIPIPVDALGTARRLHQTAEKFGKDSLEYQDHWQVLMKDCQRLLAEAYRKNTWEYFPKTVQNFDHETGEYRAHGQSLIEIVAGGLSPLVSPEEAERRQNEFVEEKTYQAIGQMGLRNVVSLTISECPDWAIESYSHDNKTAHGGYVPEINKLVLRGVEFFGGLDVREEEQLALSGVYITHEVVLETMRRLKIISVEQNLTKSQVQSKQIITSQIGVIDFAKLLDQVAAESSGENIFLGEAVAADHPKNYAAIEEESQNRQRQQYHQARTLVSYVEYLQREGVDRWAAVAMVENYVKEELLKIARKDPKQAANMFDEKTAEGFRAVGYLESIGHIQQAQRLLEQVEAQAPAPSYCGAGSCGLEKVEKGSELEVRAKELGLDGSKGLLSDKERSCPGCKNKSIVYDLKGKKGCISCKATAKYQ